MKLSGPASSTPKGGASVAASRACCASTNLRAGSRRREQCTAKSSFVGTQLASGGSSNGSIGRATMARWLENKASVDVPAPLETCWAMWENNERIPEWMPWIKSVQFGRDWEFSWLARNLRPLKWQKIHWVSEPGSASMPGLEVANRGQIRFVKRGQDVTGITLTISYEVPEILVPFASALTPVVESIIATDLRRFRDMMASSPATSVSKT
ncbi:hypothetical protein DUNSADRAFT_6608 [Dunaliella salina]|uniref:Coenzyme Q-binding protein COQ10 START domain-containing protein n=1 Tax=Dunaliella salina TaxID=3046 RepID=A0ABQ7GN03_DUNSA|nr:hypothetical protein DUNSADRAFT_6608 [Dunaliella salina]|eukprot:KAF5835992.1 hypothetical protein DUNSADRAFT_6608 [Dunaliella salina]